MTRRGRSCGLVWGPGVFSPMGPNNRVGSLWSPAYRTAREALFSMTSSTTRSSTSSIAPHDGLLRALTAAEHGDRESAAGYVAVLVVTEFRRRSGAAGDL